MLLVVGIRGIMGTLISGPNESYSILPYFADKPPSRYFSMKILKSAAPQKEMRQPTSYN
jgi:hypothetical protein